MLSAAPLPAVNAAAAALPVGACLPAALAVLARGRNLLLVAPPGAGKTTLLPLALLQAPWRGDDRILVLEPRRLAARAAAHRMAELLGEPAGQRIGYRTRVERLVSAATRVEVVTTGLLVRRLLDDPGLHGVAAVVLDEVHERALDADLALALLLDLQAQLRPELRLVAMSATADADRLARLMDAETVASDGRAHPIAISHARRDIAALRDLPAAMAAAVRTALQDHAGDLLCFLPGMGDIRRTQAALADLPAEVLALHGDLPAAEQQQALQPQGGPGGRRRVVLATSIAETSLTVPGVRVVIDGGWRRAPRLDGATGLTRLATLRISRAAAAQRAGRAGREAPGTAIRLWTQATHRALPEHDRPEILEAELSGLVLDCAGWGAMPERLTFADPPPPGQLAAARTLLATLGALDPGDRLTAQGRAMAALGAHPRLGAMMLAASNDGERALAADLAATLEERDFRSRPARGGWAPADVTLRCAVLQGGAGDVDRAALSRVRQAAEQYRRRLGLAARHPAAGPAGPLLAAAFPDRIAQARGEPGRFRLSGGGSASLPATDPLARAALLVVAAIELGTASRIALAAVLDPQALPPALAAQVHTSVETALDPVGGTVLARRRRRLGALVLDDRTEPADPALRAGLLARHAGEHLATLPWTDAARQFQARVALMRGLEPDAWPDLADQALAATVRDWLEPMLEGRTRLADLDLAALLRARLDWGQRTRLDHVLPPALALPRGTAAVDYRQPVPQAAARAQAFYGLAGTPRLADGRIGLRLALLSPAGRPIAITADLAAFWTGGWTDARRDMRGRYPKHDWPEHPGPL